MENVNPGQLSEWVTQQIAVLDPPDGWQPGTEAALGRFCSRLETARPRSRRPWAWALAGAFLIAAIALLPPGRVAAQQIWQFLTVPKVAFIRVNPWPKGVPSPQVRAGMLIPPIPARDTEEVRGRVHYDPRLPRPGVLSGSPQLYTTFSLSAGTVIKVADLELALHKAGVMDQPVPREWDGARLALHTSSIVMAEWPGILFAQSLPLTLTAPASFDFPAFSALILRVLGVGPEEARKLARQMGTAPPWLAPISRDMEASAMIEEIAVGSGPATLLTETDKDGSVKRITVVWSVPDRVYLLTGQMTRELAIAAANAVQ